MLQKSQNVGDGKDLNAVHNRRLRRVGGRDEHRLHTAVPRGDHHGQYAAHRAHLAGQRQLPQKGGGVQRHAQLTGGFEQRQQQRQIIYGAFFFHVRRCQIDGDPADGVREAAVFQRGANPVARFAHGRAGRPHHVKAG